MTSFLVAFTGCVALMAGMSACSPSVFFGSSEDTGIANQIGYRRINMSCAGLDMGSSHLDVPTFRKLLHCFNSNGALEPIEALVNRLPDADVRPIVDVGNRYLINNPKLMYQLEVTLNTLGEKKILDETFLQLGRLLENEEFVSSSIALLKEGYSLGGGRSGLSPDQDLLRVLEKFSTKITPEKVGDALDTALTVAKSKVFGSAQAHFRGDSPSGRHLRDLTDAALAFLQQTGDPNHVDAGLRLLDEVLSGSLFAAMDSPEMFGREPERFRLTVPRLASVLKITLSDNARVMDGLTSLFHYVHRPIQCLKGSQTVADGVMYIVRELSLRPTSEAASFVKRGGILSLMAFNPLCEFPPELATYYPYIFSLADTTAIEPATDMLKTFYRVSSELTPDGRERHPLAELLVSILSDTGSAEYASVGGPPENTVGIKRILPILAELTDRGAWEDLLLLLTLPREEDRADIQELVRFVLEPLPGRDRSVYDVLTDAVSRASPEALYNFVYSLRRFVQSDRPLLEPALLALRRAFYVNDVNPVVGLVHDVLADAGENDRLFNTMFIISEMPEFRASVRLVSDMAKDGRLKELVSASTTLFHKFALKGRTEVHLASEPVFVSSARHDLSEADLGGFPIESEPAVSNGACRALDLGFSLGDTWDERFWPQLSHFAACMDADRRHGDFSDVIDFLSRARTERSRSYVELLVDLVRSTDFTREQLGYLGASFIRSVDNQRVFRMLDAVPLLVRGVASKVEPVLRPALEVFRPVMGKEARAGVDRLQLFAASVLRRASFPVVLRYVDRLLDREPEPSTAQEPLDYDWQRLRRWVWNKECTSLPPNPPSWQKERYQNARIAQIVSDYHDAVTSWDLVDGQPRRSWKFGEFRDSVDDLLTKFGDPAQGVRPGAQLDAMLNFMRYFTLPDDQREPNAYQHFHRSELRKFLADRSSDYRLITYYYPGETRPRVRLVNSLDRLDLVLINADLWTQWPPVIGRKKRNFGLMFLAQVGEAWGDEPESAWPKEIRKKFAGRRPPTLAEAVREMIKTSKNFEQLVGLPPGNPCRQEADPRDPPEVQYAETHDPEAKGGGLPSWLPGMDVESMQRSLFNIHQVISVLSENLPAPGQPLGEGGKMVNGMRILRDLFYELYYSTPEAYRTSDFANSSQGVRNNLSIIVRLVRAGLTRAAARKLRGLDADDPQLADFFDSLIEGSTLVENPEDPEHPRYKARQLLDPLVDPKLEPEGIGIGNGPKHELLWGVVKEVFAIVDAGEGRDLDEAHRKELQGKRPEEAARIREEWKKELLRLRQTAFFGLASAGPMGLVDPVLTTVGPLLRTYSGYLSKNTGKVQDALRSKKTSWFMRALYEDQDQASREQLAGVLRDLLRNPQNGIDLLGTVKAIDEDPRASDALDAVSDRWDLLSELPEYKALRLDEVNRETLDFLEEQINEPGAREAAQRLRYYLAERLEQGDLDQLLLLGKSDPDEFYQMLEMISTHVQDGELKDLIAMSRRALSP